MGFAVAMLSEFDKFGGSGEPWFELSMTIQISAHIMINTWWLVVWNMFYFSIYWE
jgi:hypothetical protein